MTELFPPPPAEFPIMDEHTGGIWRRSDDGEYAAIMPNGTIWSETWEDLARGKYGKLTVLVPVPYSADMDDTTGVIAASVGGVFEKALVELLDKIQSIFLIAAGVKKAGQ